MGSMLLARSVGSRQATRETTAVMVVAEVFTTVSFRNVRRDRNRSSLKLTSLAQKVHFAEIVSSPGSW